MDTRQNIGAALSLRRFIGAVALVPAVVLAAVLAAALAVTLVGCGATDSSNVKSGGIRANLTVEARGDGTSNVIAEFTVGSGGLVATYLELKSGDSASAIADGVNKVLRKDTNLLGGISYENTFATDAAETLFTVSLTRADDTSAPNSTVRMPQAFEITAPDAEQRFGIDQNLPVIWAPSGYSSSMEFGFTARCPRGAPVSTRISIRTSADTGSFSPGIRSIIGDAADNLSPGSQCTLEMEVIRSRSGNLDPNYGEGGSIKARQIRKRSVVVDIL
ncbi:MAG: hypothetical protein WBP60_00240 [Gammaproteobacteria bacterium]